MAGPVARTTKTVEKEVLVFPAGLDAIQSVVLSASGVAALPSATTGYAGKLGLLAGTILKKVSGDGQDRYTAYNGTGTPEGVLGDNIYFFDNTHASDRAADMLFHGCVFDTNKLIGYAGNETAVKNALATCKFLDKAVG
jgi:hypothetical protein